MKARPLLSPLPARGSALVIILAFVVLATVLVLAFFSRSILERQMSNASASQTKVDILAHSAVDTIVGDLKQEIAAGSTSTNVGPTTNQTMLYFPTSVTNMIPARSGNPTFTGSPTNDPIPNLIRRSVRSDPLAASGYIGVAASAAGSTNLSANGRSVSPARWNSHYLIPRLNAGSAAIDTTPVAAFTAPDWVFVTTNGPTTLTAPTNTVIGRYAYAIYDEGGLLDANVAGFPSGLTNYPNAATNVVGYKGSAALADLSVIGITNVDNLIGWRNYGTVKPAANSLGSFSFQGDANVSSNYYQYLTNGTNSGFVTVSTNSFNGRTDQMFTSRQALLKFRRATGFSQDALQYLGTFSRDLEQPSFYPDPNIYNSALAGDAKAKRPKNTLTPVTSGSRGNGNDTYSSDGSLQDKVNPALLSIRDVNGEPTMKRRFPLSRLALIKTNPSATEQADILKYFGLNWDQANARWVYNHGDPSRIYALSEISGREPDFFETLKAVINCDSLGKQHAGLDTSASPHGSSGSLIDGQTHNQIIQIGANIIDQYDSDSYPTHLQFNGRDFYGVENLPYLAGWQLMWYRMKALAPSTDISTSDFNTGNAVPTAADGTTYETAVMIQPIIWNPHARDSNATPPGLPTQFRIVASAMTDDVATPVFPQTAKAWWSSTTSVQHTYPATPTYAAANSMTTAGTNLYQYPNITIDPKFSILTFNTGAGDAAFREPFRLRTVDYPSGSNATNDSSYPEGKLVVTADPGLITADGGSTTAIGFYCGRCWTGPAMNHANNQKWLSVGYVNKDLKFKLQYKDASGAWQTYDVIENVYNASGNVSTVDNSDVLPYMRAFRTCFRADPRTDRWGLFHLATFPSPSGTPTGLTQTAADNGVDGGYGNNAMTHYYLAQGTTLKPSAGSTYITVGAAGGAAAPGWLNTSTSNPADLTVNLPRTPNSNPNSGTKATGANPLPPGEKYYYTDPDGVFRRGVGAAFSGTDGIPLYSNNLNSRPVILNRPFKSVAEMGYAFKGHAWRDLDFLDPESGDAALLDAFCISELQNAPNDVSVAGRVNLNTRQAKVLQAIIQGVSKAEGGALNSNEAQNAALALVNWTGDVTTTTAASSGQNILNKGPLRNRSELVGKFVYQVPFSPAVGGLTGAQSPILDGSKSYQGFSSMLTSSGIFSTSSDTAIKRRSESVIRALADTGNTRTWNLLIDLVAQVGRYPATASSLDQFMVEGETRVWIHLAIDRYTGKVIAKQIESVTE